MSVFFISDLHLGHKNILKFAGDHRHGDTPLENLHMIVRMWNAVVTKRDKVFVLGDVVFDKEYWDVLDELRGRKVLVRGNHDNYFKTEQWLEHFESVESMVRYKDYWLTHCPIHPCELRGRKNIHGHVHQNSVMRPFSQEPDDRYINVCVENTGGAPINLERIKAGEKGWYHYFSEDGLLRTQSRKPLIG